MSLLKNNEYSDYLSSFEFLNAEDLTVDDGILDYQFKFFESLINKLVKGEGLVFNTLFAKISYLGLKFKLNKRLVFDLHLYRKEFENNFIKIDSIIWFRLGQYLLGQLLRLLTGDEQLAIINQRPSFNIRKTRFKGRKLFGRYSLISKRNSEEYIVIDEDNPEEELILRVDNLDVFKNSIKYINDKIDKKQLPLTIELVYINIDASNALIPDILIIEPDFLVDVTSIAECFKTTGGDARYYLINKYLPKPLNKYVTIGNIVNFFLDELMKNSSLEFEDLLFDIFHIDPIMFTLMKDAQVKEVIRTLKQHFANLKKVIDKDFKHLGIEKDKCYLEPSFFSPIFGIQGRLDVFYQKDNNNEAAIIELKSGKLFRPNTYGLNTNHYTQTLLYEMLVKSVYGFKLKPLNYILYSVLDENNIRFAPSISAQQKEAISIRNDIVILEDKIIEANDLPTFFKNIDMKNYPLADGFLKRDIEKIQLQFKNMSKLELDYFSHFTSFIAREHKLAKTGYSGEDDNTGQSALWLLNNKEKEAHFSILKNYKLIDDKSTKGDSILVFANSDSENQMANIRKGDIVLLYPANKNNNFSIESQVFKSTVLSINTGSIVLRLRSELFNKSIFNRIEYWNIEHDFLDSGFSKMHKNLFKFFEFDKDKRNLVLGIKEPGKPVNTNDKDLEEDLTILQKSVVNSILSSQDYYLLWGPPGTGKTSKIIRSVVNASYQKGQQIMLLAYTNRAVDELCEAVESISEEMKNLYYRIGSKYSSGKDYAENLFDNKIKSISTRKKFQEFIDKIPIVVGTVSSIQGKEGLFSLKKFDTLIVDEASQLLEPMLLSIIPYFNKFVLVGDHRQLPAVVKQKNTDSTVKSEELKEIGLTNLSNSLFERLLQNAERKNWSWAIGMLQEQGRMHSDIMKLPNDLFYEGKLKTINSIHRLENPLKLDHSKSEVQEVLASNRLIFVPSQINRNQVLSKINIDEANKIKTIIENIIEIYNRNNLEINEKTIGIITTFRSQITKIKHELENYGIDISKISIDTVERYQGSARDIIIFSMSVNSVSRLKQIISKDDDGIDRKLNVVITRAKEQFILLGNENIIEKNDLYRSIKNNSSVLNLDI